MKKLTAILLAAIMVISLAACGSGSEQAPASPTAEAAGTDKLLDSTLVIKVSWSDTKDDYIFPALEAAAKNITERTNGEIEFELYPGGTLAGLDDAMEQAMSGANIIFGYGLDNLGDYVPSFIPAGCPYTFLEWTDLKKLRDSDWMDERETELNDIGMQAIAMCGFGGFRHFISKCDLSTPESFKGKIIRMGAANASQKFAEALGGSPTTTSWADNYNLLDQGVIDACEASLITLWNSSLYEVGTNLTLTGHFATPFNLLCSSELWGKIPEAYQGIVREEFENALDVFSQEISGLESDYLDKFAEKGTIITEVDKAAFQEYLPKLYEILGLNIDDYYAMRASIENA